MYRAVNNEKIGNLLVYLATKIPDLGITKLSKLLFLIDERAVKETGVPITWVEYEAWHLGPVPKEIYFQIKHDENVLDKGKEQKLSQFVEPVPSQMGTYDGLLIKPRVAFCDDEFSDYELELIDSVIASHGTKTAAELVKLTHSEDSLWAKVVEKEGLRPQFDSGIKRTSVTVNLHSAEMTEEQLLALRAAHEGMQQREFHYIQSASRENRKG